MNFANLMKLIDSIYIDILPGSEDKEFELFLNKQGWTMQEFDRAYFSHTD